MDSYIFFVQEAKTHIHVASYIIKTFPPLHRSVRRGPRGQTPGSCRSLNHTAPASLTVRDIGAMAQETHFLGPFPRWVGEYAQGGHPTVVGTAQPGQVGRARQNNGIPTTPPHCAPGSTRADAGLLRATEPHGPGVPDHQGHRSDGSGDALHRSPSQVGGRVRPRGGIRPWPGPPRQVE